MAARSGMARPVRGRQSARRGRAGTAGLRRIWRVPGGYGGAVRKRPAPAVVGKTARHRGGSEGSLVAVDRPSETKRTFLRIRSTGRGTKSPARSVSRRSHPITVDPPRDHHRSMWVPVSPAGRGRSTGSRPICRPSPVERPGAGSAARAVDPAPRSGRCAPVGTTGRTVQGGGQPYRPGWWTGGGQRSRPDAGPAGCGRSGVTAPADGRPAGRGHHRFRPVAGPARRPSPRPPPARPPPALRPPTLRPDPDPDPRSVP